MKEWNGVERRKDGIERDRLLSKIDANLENLLITFSSHAKDDSTNFEQHRRDINWLQRITYMGLGAVFLMEFMLKFLK